MKNKTQINPKYKLIKLHVGLVSALIGFGVMVGTPMIVHADTGADVGISTDDSKQNTLKVQPFIPLENLKQPIGDGNQNIENSTDEWRLTGVGNWQYGTVSYDTNNRQLIISGNGYNPHDYYGNNVYSRVSVNRNQNNLYQHEFIGNKGVSFKKEVQLQANDTFSIFQDEPGRIQPSTENLKYTDLNQPKTFTYQVTNQGTLLNLTDYVNLTENVKSLFKGNNRNQLALGISESDLQQVQQTVTGNTYLSSEQRKRLLDQVTEAINLFNHRPSGIDNGVVKTVDVFSIAPNEATNREGRPMGNSMDRQALGITMTKGAQIQVKVTQSPKATDTLTLDLIDSSSKNEQLINLKSSDDWVTVTAEADNVPYIKTPSTGSYQVQYRIVSGRIDELPIFSHDSKQETVQTKWDASKSPYALMQAYNIQLQIPYSDILRVMQTNMDDLLNQYDQQVFKLYAELTGIQYNQSSHPVVRRYFAMPDKNGIGAAYYNGGRWIAINGSSVASYLTIGWLTLHEIAHGYEVPSDWMQIIDNFNNVYGTIYQAKYTYPTNQEFSHKSWIYDGGKEKNIQQVIQEVLTQHQNFNQVGLRERLILLLSLADYKNTDSWKIFNEYHRKVANDGKNSSDLGKDWIQSFKDSYNVDVTPYFLLMGVPIDQVTMLNLANSNSEPIVPLAQVVDKNKINNVIAQLGWDQDSLKNELSLVSTNDLLKTRLTGTTKLTFTNPSLAKGHQFELRNGNQIIKKFELPANGDLTFTDLPIGVYTLISDDGTISLLNPYVYVKSDSIQSQSMTLTDNILTKVRDLFTDNSYSQLKPSITLTQLKQAEELVNNLSNKALQLANSKLTQRASAMIEQITLMGGSNVIFNTISDNNGTGTLTIQSYPVQPHWAFGDDVYSTIDIYDSKGKSVYSNHIIASQTQPNKVVTLANADGYKVVITHKEGPSRLQADLGNVTITPSNKQIFMVQDGKLVPGYPNEELIVPETVSFKVGEVKNNDELLNLINPKIMPKTSALKFDIVGSDVDFDHEGNYQVVIKATDNHQKLQSIVNVKVIGNVIPTHEVGEPLIQPEKSTLTLPTHEVGEPLIQPEKPTLTLPTHEVGEPLIQPEKPTLTLPTHEVGEPLIQPEKPTLTLPTHEVGEPLIQPEKLILSVTGNDVNSMILFEKVDNTSNKEFNLKVSHEIISTTNNKQVDKTDDKLQDMSNTLPQTGESINQANPKIGILGLLITVLMGLIGVKKYKHN